MKINLTVYPKSSKQEIQKIEETYYKVYLKKPPHEGKANMELIKILKKYFKRDVKIVKGQKSRNKIIEVDDNRN